MEREIKTRKLHIRGMTCVGCENKIAKKLRNTAGIESVEVNYSTNSATVAYDTDLITIYEIMAIIEGLDYNVLPSEQSTLTNRQPFHTLLIVVAIYILLQRHGFGSIFNVFPTAEIGMSYWMLFVIGLLTSVHCVAMCGGINLSQCIPKSRTGDSVKGALLPSFLYNFGRVISYTVVGGIVGALGSVLTLTGEFRGIIQLIAGVFMVIMALNLLGIFPELSRFMPRIPIVFARKIDEKKSESKSPLVVGLLNGLMPCGPLQAMQIYALSTGSAFSGALSMLLFSLGTVPLMFGLGALSSVLSKKFTHKVMTVGASLVLVLGLSMLSNGWSLSGFSLDFLPGVGGGSQVVSEAVMENGYQVVNSTLASGKYPRIAVQEGTPVKWMIEAPKGSINGCNNRFFIKEYGIEHQFNVGTNIIEFTPTKAGTFSYSCWMGMIRSTITVL